MGETIADPPLRVEQMVGRRGFFLPPERIDEISEPFGNSVHQTRSGVSAAPALRAGRVARRRRAGAAVRSGDRRRASRAVRRRLRPVSCGDTIVWVEPARAPRHPRLAARHAGPGVQLPDRRDRGGLPRPERALEVVYQLRSLPRKADLRVKVPLDNRRPLEVRLGLRPLEGADWLEREVFDMFGVRFAATPICAAS